MAAAQLRCAALRLSAARCARQQISIKFYARGGSQRDETVAVLFVGAISISVSPNIVHAVQDARSVHGNSELPPGLPKSS